jgi:site-specific DNA-methyltransferase (adenine-specific)
MTPYYQDDHCTIYHGDAREIVGLCVADALVTDPPYGVGLKTKLARNHGRGGASPSRQASVTYADEPDVVRELITSVIPAALAVTKRGLVFTGTRMMFDYPRPDGFGAVYSPAAPSPSPWGFQTAQPILYYGSDPYLANRLGNRPNGFIHPGADAESFDHPCPKPLRWMTWAVNRITMPGESVLDPFMGSGTTLRAAKDLNRKAIGIEIEERYCEIAAKRLAQEVLPL